ncbi:MAG: DUF4446 family protein [Chloroflexi bacterium]|nr:DUF4446 family protein [Chloroflexota bacterium]
MEVNNLIIAFLILLLLGWAVLTEFRYRRLARSFRALMMGRAGADLETVLVDHVARMGAAEKNLGAIFQRVQTLETKQPFQIQHVGVVRFNPFADKGGDQSFVVAILDDHTDGVVISALHARVDLRVYAKLIVGGQSTHSLTVEEREVIARAMKPRA